MRASRRDFPKKYPSVSGGVFLKSATFEEITDLGKEAAVFRACLGVIVTRFFLELFKKFALALGQVMRCFHRDLNVHVATGRRPQYGEALAAQAEGFTCLRPRRNADTGAASINNRNLNLRPQRSLRHAQRNAAVDIGAVTLEDVMR